MASLRYGVYLLPAQQLAAAVAAVHGRLAREHGLGAAMRFMPHVTLKGFFRTEAQPAELEARLGPALHGRPPVTLNNAGAVGLGPETIALDVDADPGGGRNHALHALHEAAFDAMGPCVAPGCEFTAVEFAGNAFRAHLTLAMADIPPGRFAELVALLTEAPIGPPSSEASEVALFAFESRDWAGSWWETLTWRPVASYLLADGRPPG
jgi:2'-5' RNA ligase